MIVQDLLGAFNAARGAFAQLRETRGCIVFISAGQAFVPQAHQVHVGAAKAGIDNLMKNLALIPLRRYGQTDDIGQAPVFLASSLAAYITGTVLAVDGGSNLVGSALWNQFVAAMHVPRR
jgi:NAD(P)-dependent dehydrogenase (short-subunit alcohol dehydrogenase family)